MSLLQSGLTEGIEPRELISRFILYKRYFSRPDGKNYRVKPPAFIPDPYDELSVSRIDGLNEGDFFQLGEPVATSQGKPILGAAVLTAANVIDENLGLIPDEPPERHANIIDWPKNEDPKEQKSSRMLMAMVLADNARFHPC